MSKRGDQALYRRDLAGPEGLAVAAIAQAARDIEGGDLCAWLWLSSGASGLMAALGDALDLDVQDMWRHSGMTITKEDLLKWRDGLCPEDREAVDQFVSMLTTNADAGSLVAFTEEQKAALEALVADLQQFADSESPNMAGIGGQLALWGGLLQGWIDAAEMVAPARQFADNAAVTTLKAPPILLKNSEREPYRQSGGGYFARLQERGKKADGDG